MSPDGAGTRLVRREAAPLRRSRLADSLEMVLADAARRYRGIDMSVMAADTDGFVIGARPCSDVAAAWMTAAGLSVGLCVAEEAAATNALGSVLETGKEFEIDEGEHFLTRQARWVAAGAPIVDPPVGRCVGALALICPQGPLSPLLLADARDLAGSVGDHLADESVAADRALLEAFLHSRRRRRIGVVGIGRHLLVTDRQAHEMLGDVGHAALWERARGPAPTASSASALTIDTVIRSRLAIDEADEDSGVVLEIARQAKRERPSKRSSGDESLDGLVGRSASWRAIVRDVCAHRDSRHSVLISGERGTGKASIAIAIATQRGSPDRSLAVLDCADVFVIGLPAWLQKARAETSRDENCLVLRHLDLLDERSAAALRSTLDSETPGRARVLGTLDSTASVRGPLGALTMQLGVGRIEIPPLRRRPDDIASLATEMIHRHASRGYEPRLRPDTLAALRRYDWPGNVRELANTVQSVLARRSVGDLRPADLPHAVQSGGKDLMLTAIQQSEKEAILGALRNCNNNKAAAAANLGLARSTLYRKITAYGLDRTKVY